MSPRNWKFRLEDIVESLELIAEYTSEMSQDLWRKDRKTIDAVIRNIEIIGEAASRVPEDIQELYPNIPWYQMKGMRNILIHEYFGVDFDVIWKTTKEDLPPLLEQIRKLINNS